jgi:membrane peptidoglycan carboxypeptidase
MSDQSKPTGRRRPGKNTFTTKSGGAIKLNRSLGERIRANRDAKARRRAAYLSTLPKNRFKRILYRMQPRELARYWFSRDGLIMALKITGVGIVLSFIFIVGIFAYFRKDLPNINNLSGQKLGGSITYYDRTGKTVLWQDYDAVKRVPVEWENIAQDMKDATIAIEDKDYYKHGAFDIRGIARAGFNNVFKRGGGTQGGSTISQQVVKLNQDWTADRTIARKVKEVILAVELEREYSKDDILKGYLNLAPYGPVQYGVEVASADYFGIKAKDLSLAQSAFLAAIPKAPSTYSPYGPTFSAEALIGRQQYILDQMVAQKMISKEEAATAKAEDFLSKIKPREQKYAGIRAPYFVLAAKDELERDYGEDTVLRGGWKVTTTVDLGLQDLAERKVSEALPIVKRQGGDSAAFVAMDNKTGQIVALVGGDPAQFNNDESSYGKLNFGHSVKVSPGSTFKPYDYASFIENNNAGAGSVLYDTQGPLPGWPCDKKQRPKEGGNCLWDYDFRYPGPITLRYALGGSRNITAVKAMLGAVPNDSSPGRVASINKTIATAESMMGNTEGYACYQDGTDVFTATKEQETQCYGSSAIGDGAYLKLDDHVTGLSTLSREGKHIPRTYILKITDSDNKVIDEFKQPNAKQVLKPDTAYIVTNMLADPNASYLSRKFHRYKGWEFAIKTGTTNDAFDGLMASWSSQYTVVTWVGYHNRNKAMTGFMENMTTPIVRGWMESAHDALGTKPVNWTKPDGVKSLPAYVIRSKVGLSSVEPSTSNDLFPSWYKPPNKTGGTNQTIDVVSNKLATTCTPDLAKKNDSNSSDNAFSVDPFVGAGNTGTTSDPQGADDIHNCNDDKPSITLTAPASCNSAATCIFTVTVSKGTHNLSGGAYTASPASSVTLFINGQGVEAIPIPADSPSVWTHSFSYAPTSSGSASVQTQVVDSVLYSASESASVTFP